MKNSAVKIGIIASLVPHLFCCVLPIGLSVLSLFGPEFAHLVTVDEWIEPWLFVLSALMLGVSWVLVMQDCKCRCKHCHDTNNHHRQKTILVYVTLLFVISVILHVVSHY